MRWESGNENPFSEDKDMSEWDIVNIQKTVDCMRCDWSYFFVS